MRYRNCKFLMVNPHFSCKFYHMKPRKAAHKKRQNDLFRVELIKIIDPAHCLAKILRKLEELNYLPSKGEDTEEPSPNEEVYSIEDEDKIKKRLEDLGYI